MAAVMGRTSEVAAEWEDADGGFGDSGFGDGGFSDEELTALALAADPDQPLDPDATPLAMYPVPPGGALPLWYMPPVTARRVRGWRAPMIVAIVAAFLLINALGLCITYGQLVIA
jgi:hypothetical protein